ncbi:50S ribosomal protein L11 methyltransferase [Helicobacter sp. 11S02596-1]|uniref:50S ribosomal protein L11 methyltransferase n=1 Tax=Helicobacter sp. 11S02596-1 TaxID=1476194 RepID=UPI000BA51A76|nr:50S ribosomal protein L11 methyltransferase [Helicobacter sp. 11S02596-1]PAF44746.1 hypothetical protein BJI48_01800 [Helicobacter sp. 11S02596-1]
MQEHYFETLIIPSDCDEVFADFLIEITQDAIEERDIHSDVSKILDNPIYLNISQIPSPKKALIVYGSSSPEDSLIPALKDFCSQLSTRLNQNIGVAYESKICKNQDWIQNYQASITPIWCGRFYIRPSWCEPPKTPDELANGACGEAVQKSHQTQNLGEAKNPQKVIDILIDPALAFGSGHHASTAMCLQMLSEMDLSGKDVLDVGCGSGILSIAAKKLGARVQMCDTDVLAVKESQKNFALNALEVDKIWEGSIQQAPQKYDLIIANILADVLKLLHQDFLHALKPHSVLILSGILEDYESSVLETFTDFEVLEILHLDEWVGVKLTQK